MTDLFTTTVVDSLGDVAPFGNWLMQQARDGTVLSLAVRDRQKKLAISSRNDAYVLDLKAPAAPIVLGVLQKQLVETTQLKLTMRDIARDLPELVNFLAPQLGVDKHEFYNVMSDALVGDLTAAARCVNQPVTPPAKFRKLEQDAFEVALLLPQYEYGVAPYYAKIGLPLHKLLAQTVLFGAKAEPAWWVTYQHLWLRVLAFYTGDPTLAYALAERHDPFTAMAVVLHCTAFEAELYLLWQACGRDMDVFSLRFPARLNDLPDDILARGEFLDKALPAMAVSIQQMKQAYYNTLSVTTRFERQLRPGHPVGEAVAFRVFGTVEELISVAAVTFWNNRPARSMMITKFQGGPAEDNIRIAGTSPGQGIVSWLQELRMLAPLGNPLSQLGLNPLIVQP